MTAKAELQGQKFHRLTFTESDPENGRRWFALCECGKTVRVYSCNVKAGLTKSCGCLNRELASQRFKKDVRVKDDPEYLKVYGEKYRERNREALLEAKRAYRKANKQRVSEAKRQCYLKRRDHYLGRIKANYEADPEATITRARRAATLHKEATPEWADQALIKALYRLARRLTKETGTRHHVDHIVPLRSDLVCGLHTHTNLRVLPAPENWKKHNSFDPDLPLFTPICHFEAAAQFPA